MSWWTYMNKIGQHWQDKPWLKLGDACPYWIGHRKSHQLDFMHDSWFRYYCSGHRRLGRHERNKNRGRSVYTHNKLFKLYWRLHPEERE